MNVSTAAPNLYQREKILTLCQSHMRYKIEILLFFFMDELMVSVVNGLRTFRCVYFGPLFHFHSPVDMFKSISKLEFSSVFEFNSRNPSLQLVECHYQCRCHDEFICIQWFDFAQWISVNGVKSEWKDEKKSNTQIPYSRRFVPNEKC